MERLRRTLESFEGITLPNQAELLTTILVVVVLWIVRILLLKLVRQRVADPRLRYRWRKFSGYTAVVVGAIFIGRIWFEAFGSLFTFLGLLSAGLVIALRDLIADFAGWVFILTRRSFVVGDRVQVKENAGDVIDLRIFQFSLLEIGNWVEADQSTGRVIHMPNRLVFSEPLINYTRGFQYIWNEVPVLITFESNWRKAKRILLEIARENATLGEEAELEVRQRSRRFLIYYSALTPTVYTRAEASGVVLTIRYLTDPRSRRGGAEVLWEAVLDAFAAENDIDFAYPTTRFYDNVIEGKSGARAEVPAEGRRV